MQSFDTNSANFDEPTSPPQAIDAGRVDELPPGTARAIALPEGQELAIYNINGEFYATENFCPHKGAPLVNGTLCEYIVECDWHGWQFDVRTGDCLTVPERIATYEVLIDDGRIKVLV